MIVSFTVENFKSYKTPTLFAMQTSLCNIDNLTDNFIKNKNYLTNINRFGLIYGANSAGKTNLFDALEYLIKYLKNGVISLKVPSYFNNTEDTSFDIFFYIKDVMFRYYLGVKDNKIIDEHLVFYNNETNRQNYVFHREENNEIRISNKFKYIKKYFDEIYDYEIFLSFLIYKEIIFFSDIEKYFITKLQVYNNDNSNIFDGIETSFKFKDMYKDLITKFDLGFDSIMFHGNKIKLINKTTDNKLFGYNPKGDTIKLLRAVALMVDSMLNDKIIFMDGMFDSIHTNTTKELLKYYVSKKHKGQIIIITQDSSLIDKYITRTDQIYFIDKKI